MKKEVMQILEKYNQEHLLKYSNLLTKEEEQLLEEQILKIDFAQLKQLYEQTKKQNCMQEKKIEHINYTDKQKMSLKEKEKLEKIGTEIIKKGKYAVITMAGGQGTRLGYKGPKGAFKIDTNKGQKYLFEIIVDTFKKAKEEYNITIPWYIMTSRENHEETVQFLEEKKYFGYDKTKVKFFTQGELPLIDEDGNVIVEKNKLIKEAADGNGGIYEAISKSGLLEQMQKEQIEWIFISNVDNILSHFVDPLLLGLTIEQNQKIAAKSVAKTNPKEKVGVFCKVNGKAKIIEYIDLPEEMAEQMDENGELLYGEVNIANYLFHRSVLENLSDAQLPYHAAFKKSAYLTPDGEYIEPQEPNVYKFETFIFDVFDRYDNITILRVNRQEEFAPVKNKEGADSPKTATKLYNEQHK